MTNTWIARKHRRLRKWLERKRLDRLIAVGVSVPLPVVVSRSSTQIVWRVSTSAGDRFMRSEREIPDLDLDTFIVYVDANRFYRLWLASPHSDSRKYLSLHPKHDRAHEGFSRGESDPVPLADFVMLPAGSYSPVEIDSGITRTSWLLINGAPSFPVRVRRWNSPQLVFDVAGLGEGPARLESLLAKPRQLLSV